MKKVACLGAAILLAMAGLSAAQTTTPAAPVDPKIEAILQLLHDRRDTLKDFSAKLDYSVYHPKSDDTEGKIGVIHYVNDATKGPTFLVNFNINTVDGKPKGVIHQDLIFDGYYITLINYEKTAQTFQQQRAIPDGGKPGDAVSLKGQVPIPIGLDPKDVEDSFDIKLTSDDAEKAVLELVPKQAGRYDFSKVQVTVDKKLQLPVQVFQEMRNTDEVTFIFKEPAINKGEPAIQQPKKPTEPGWQIEEK